MNWPEWFEATAIKDPDRVFVEVKGDPPTVYRVRLHGINEIGIWGFAEWEFRAEAQRETKNAVFFPWTNIALVTMAEVDEEPEA